MVAGNTKKPTVESVAVDNSDMVGLYVLPGASTESVAVETSRIDPPNTASDDVASVAVVFSRMVVA
jgi:hypothetical protein